MFSSSQTLYLENLKEYIPGKSITEIASLYNLDPQKIIKLGSNENPHGSSPVACQEIFDSKSEYLSKLNLYPDSLSEMLVESLKVKFPEIGDAEIVVGNGMDNILESLARLLLSQNDQTIIHTPTFEYYEIVTKWSHAQPISVQMKEHNNKEKNNFVLNTEDIINEINDQTKIVFLCSPNNPTGNILEWSDIKQIILKAEQYRATVFLDEAYSEFSGITHIDKVQMFPNLIIGKTFSKIYGLASQRIGWAVIPKTYLKFYRKIQTPFNTNLIGLILAKKALFDNDFVQYTLEQNEIGRQFLSKELKKMNFTVFNTHSNFISFLVGEEFNYSASEFCLLLLKRGIIVRNASLFKDAPKNLIRLTIGKSIQNNTVIENIKEMLLTTQKV